MFWEMVCHFNFGFRMFDFGLGGVCTGIYRINEFFEFGWYRRS